MRVPVLDLDAVRPAGTPRLVPVRHAAASSTTPTISLTRLAWFDANGDGEIDTRAAGAGGDATLLVPTHEVDLPTYPRVASRDVGAANPALARQAVDAYARYGQPTFSAVSAVSSPAMPAPVALPTSVADATSAASVVGAGAPH